MGNAAAKQPKPQGRIRWPALDALRGTAVVMMIAYHFLFDLNHFGILHQNVYDDMAWISARSAILGSFLALAGVSLTLAAGDGVQWRAYGARLACIAACAVMVSIGSYLIFPQTWIYFGVLHFIVVASVLGLAFVQLKWANLVMGIALIVLGVTAASALFDRPWLNWIGLMTHKPATEDYVPLLPWFGVLLIGMFAGRYFWRGAARSAVLDWQANGTVGRALIWAGRHSLAIYMVHQPLLIGVLYLAVGRR